MTAWCTYALIVAAIAAFFVGRGTAAVGAYQRGHDDGRDQGYADATTDLSALAPFAHATDFPAAPHGGTVAPSQVQNND